jgi:hypothetical protein
MQLIKKYLKYLDQIVSRGTLKFSNEKATLMTFLFHSLFYDEKEFKSGLVNPQQMITQSFFRQFIEYFLENGYQFLSHNEILMGLPEGKFVMITFDDGYYNNQLAVSILQEFNVPAVFFISSNHILENKCFWWDVLHRELLNRGASLTEINKQIVSFKKKKNCEIEKDLFASFGKKALVPRSDIDRPFTPSEL